MFMLKKPDHHLLVSAEPYESYYWGTTACGKTNVAGDTGLLDMEQNQPATLSELKRINEEVTCRSCRRTSSSMIK